MSATPARNFDEITDVVVVGCGYAGCNAAIAAHDAGAAVVMLEKMPDPGGISICSGGGIRIASDASAAFAYLSRTNAQTAPDDVLRTLANGMTQIDQVVRQYADTAGATLAYRDAPGIYPFQGRDSFRFVMIESVAGFEPLVEFPQARSLGAGLLMFKVLHDNLRHRRIDLRLDTPVTRLITATVGTCDTAVPDQPARVLGVCTSVGGTVRRIGARRGVILACGGFEAAPQMQRQYWQGTPVFSTSFLGNTGDGIRMAQAVGADLWHMWHFHGTYGFKPDNCPVGVRTKRLPDWFPGGNDDAASSPASGDDDSTGLFSDSRAVKMPWILLDQDGNRFTNEYEPYLQDTGHRAMDRYEPERQRFARIPAWLVGDSAGLAQFAWGQPIYNDRGISLTWSADNRAEVDSGLIMQAPSLTALAKAMGVQGTVLNASVKRWNLQVSERSDEDFSRPAASMMAIAQAPFYAARVWPLVSNTQGGPVHDAQQRVLNPFGASIPGLWAAGELGSVFGHLYLSGGNLAECFIGGRIAGGAAAGNAAVELTID